MRTNKIQMQSQPTFGRLKIIKSSGFTEKVEEAILQSPAIKNFGKRYDADVYYREYLGATGKTYKGMAFANIRPSNIIVSFLDNIMHNRSKRADFLDFNSHKTTEFGLIRVLKELDKNAMIKILHS